MFNIVLVHPEIPPNTGNVIRLAANTGCRLHLVEPLGFSMEDKLLRRAGLDYHETAAVRRHASWEAFLAEERPPRDRSYALSSKATVQLPAVQWQAGDWMVFGCETAGLPDGVRSWFEADRLIRLPMRPGQRSLNLSNAVAVTVFEGWRQLGYAGAHRQA